MDIFDGYVFIFLQVFPELNNIHIHAPACKVIIVFPDLLYRLDDALVVLPKDRFELRFYPAIAHARCFYTSTTTGAVNL